MGLSLTKYLRATVSESTADRSSVKGFFASPLMSGKLKMVKKEASANPHFFSINFLFLYSSKETCQLLVTRQASCISGICCLPKVATGAGEVPQYISLLSCLNDATV